MMDQQAYENWQKLHRLVATGCALDAQQQATYEAGCRELDQDENLDGGLGRLCELRTRVKESQAEQRRLLRRAADLDAHIAVLETHLDPRTRQLLGIGV